MNEMNEDPGHLWNQRFAEQPWSVVPDVSLVELVTPLKPGRAIDLGCGTGRNALWLARMGWDVVGVDASEVGIQIAQDQAEREGLTLAFVKADLHSYSPTTASYDLVVIANMHLEPARRDRFFSRAAAAVATGGHLYLAGHHVDALGHGGPPFRDRLFSEDMFRTRFDDLSIEILERREMPSDDDGSHDVALVLWAVREASEGGAHV